MTLPHELLGAGFSGGQSIAASGGSYKSFAAAGSTQTDATVINASLALVTGADGTKGVRLPSTQSGEVCIFNNAASALKVYPPTGAAIAVNGTGVGTVNVSVNVAAQSAGSFRFFTPTQIVPILSTAAT